jgi:hypothetical protein
MCNVFDIRKKQDEGNFAIVKHVSPVAHTSPKPLIPNIDTTHNRIAIEVMRGVRMAVASARRVSSPARSAKDRWKKSWLP